MLNEYERLDKAGKGALLRREGLYTSLISEWRKQRDKGALGALGEQGRRGRPPADPLKRENQRLRAEVARLRERLVRQAKVMEVQGERSALLSRLAASSADPHQADPHQQGRSQPTPTDPTSPTSCVPIRPARPVACRRGGCHHHPGPGRGSCCGLPCAGVASRQLASGPPHLAGAARPVATPGAQATAPGIGGGRAAAGPGHLARGALLGSGAGQRLCHVAG